jgi:hypothetical protein
MVSFNIGRRVGRQYAGSDKMRVYKQVFEVVCFSSNLWSCSDSSLRLAILVLSLTAGLGRCGSWEFMVWIVAVGFRVNSYASFITASPGLMS